jgi:hypothetical protein
VLRLAPERVGAQLLGSCPVLPART